MAADLTEPYFWERKHQHSYHSNEGRDSLRNDIKSSLEKTYKCKAELRKKGISVCSTSFSRPLSLSKKKHDIETAERR